MIGSFRRKAPRERQSGQAMVETAIVLPMFVFVILGIIQLTLMQQARLMLEYAAFSAARTGAVWNGDPEKMEKAAVIALLPTMRTYAEGIPGISTLLQNLHTPGGFWVAARGAPTINQVAGNILKVKPVSVTVLNPTQKMFGSKQELEFDSGAARNSQLIIRVNYFFKLDIPFANWIIWESWFAALAGLRLGGLYLFQPTTAADFGNNFGKTSFSQRVLVARGMISGNCNRLNGLNGNKLWVLSGLALAGRYYLPMSTTHTIRMQSNAFKKFAGPDGDNC